MIYSLLLFIIVLMFIFKVALPVIGVLLVVFFILYIVSRILDLFRGTKPNYQQQYRNHSKTTQERNEGPKYYGNKDVIDVEYTTREVDESKGE